ncbi:MAG: hypothetical protein E5W25_07980, partial [Mesorhizobium sp.]
MRRLQTSVCRRCSLLQTLGAAPHLPAGVPSPYSDGERGAVTDGFANLQRCETGAKVAASLFLPVYGEK